MKTLTLVWAAVFAGTLAGQAIIHPTFIQMSDPQFGMYTVNKGFEQETANFEFAIATANRLKPAFVVITGDLINEAGNTAQTAEYKRISAKLDPAIRLFSLPGNRWPATVSISGRTTTRSAWAISPASC
jgi:3',5'-cyclic AMP phosphodiesterase CpdA